MSTQTAAFADELTKLAFKLSPEVKKDLIQGSLMGMGFESLLNPQATPTSVLREGVGESIGDVLGSGVARGLGFKGLGQFLGGMIGGEAIARPLRRLLPGKPAATAAERVARLPEFAEKQAAAQTHLTPASSNVSGYSYDPATKALRVTYKSGGTYEYKDVDPKIFRAMRRNKSVGKSINKLVKPNYEYEKVGAPWTVEGESDAIERAQDLSALGTSGLAGLFHLGSAIEGGVNLTGLVRDQDRYQKVLDAMSIGKAPKAHLMAASEPFGGAYYGLLGSDEPIFSGPSTPFPGITLRTPAATMAHEVGHYVNEQALARLGRRIENRILGKNVVDQDIPYTPATSSTLGTVLTTGNRLMRGLGMMGMANAIAQASQSETPSYAPTVGAAVLSAPLLADETMASVRAVRHLMKDQGTKRGILRSLPLAPALGTYLMGLVAPAAITYARKKYREESGATDEDRLIAEKHLIHQLQKKLQERQALEAIDEGLAMEEGGMP
jgi:hypothetical protein